MLKAVELSFDQTLYATDGPVNVVFLVITGMVSLLVTRAARSEPPTVAGERALRQALGCRRGMP